MGTVSVWDVATGAEVHRFALHPRWQAPVLAIAFSPDGASLAASRERGIIRHWSLVDGSTLAELSFEGHPRWIAFSGDGTEIHVGAEGGILRWRTADGAGLDTVELTGTPIAISASGAGFVTQEERCGPLWACPEGAASCRQLTAPQASGCVSVAISPDGTRLATGGWEEVTTVWDAARGRPIRDLTGHERYVTAIAFSPDGYRLATAGDDQTVWVWEVATGTALAVLEGYSSAMDELAFAPDGSWLATSGEDGTVRIWDTSNGREIRRLGDRTLQYGHMALSADGRRLALAAPGTDGGTAVVWDLRTGREIARYPGDENSRWTAALSPDGAELLVDGGDSHVALFDVSGSWTPLAWETEGPVMSAAFSGDGSRFHVGTAYGHVQTFDLSTGLQLSDVDLDHADIRALVSDRRRPRLYGAAGKTMHAWDGRLPETVWSVQAFADSEEHVTELTLSRDGRRIAGAGEKEIAVWDAGDGRKLHELLFSGHVVWDLALGPRSGALLAAGPYAIQYWRDPRKPDSHLWWGHVDAVAGVAFTDDERRAISASRDGSARIWDTRTGRELCRFYSFREGGWAVLDRDGRFDASDLNGLRGLVSVVDGELVPLRDFADTFHLPGLLGKVLRGERLKAVPDGSGFQVFEAEPGPEPGDGGGEP